MDKSRIPDSKIVHFCEIIKNKLYFMTIHGETKLHNTVDSVYFSVDNELNYYSYYYDFGPLNISCLYKYCNKLNAYLQNFSSKRIVYYTSTHPNTRANAAYLIGSFAVIYLGYSPETIHDILTRRTMPYRPFLDASQTGNSGYVIYLSDVISAIYKAQIYGFFDFNDFDVIAYDTYDMLRNGDLNWLLPRKFVAFIGPIDNCAHFGLKQGINCHPPSFYIHYFLKNDVRTVIRLNDRLYDETAFTRAGIIHYDMFFPDGSVPPRSVLAQFLYIAENSPGAIGVHCKAGLGRTGSLIGAYIVKHYHMTAREAISWLRVCRPGSVIGQQQGWLEKLQKWLWHEGNKYRLKFFGAGERIPHHKYGIYSIKWKERRASQLRNEKLKKLGYYKLVSEEFPSSIYSHDWHSVLGVPPSVLETYNVEQKFFSNYLRQIDRKPEEPSVKVHTNSAKGNPLKTNVRKTRTKSKNNSENVHQAQKENKSSKITPPKGPMQNYLSRQKDLSVNSKVQKQRIFSADNRTPTASRTNSIRRPNLVRSAESKKLTRTSNLKSSVMTDSKKLENENRRLELLTKLKKYTAATSHTTPGLETERSVKSSLARTQGDRLNEIKANHFSQSYKTQVKQ